jgi:hypothetical protein
VLPQSHDLPRARPRVRERAGIILTLAPELATLHRSHDPSLGPIRDSLWSCSRPRSLSPLVLFRLPPPAPHDTASHLLFSPFALPLSFSRRELGAPSPFLCSADLRPHSHLLKAWHCHWHLHLSGFTPCSIFNLFALHSRFTLTPERRVTPWYYATQRRRGGVRAPRRRCHRRCRRGRDRSA